MILAIPDFRLSTAAVFAELRPGDLGRGEPGGNDLLAPAMRLRPELRDLMNRVIEAGGEPRMTGSGSTIFALTDDPDRAAAVAAALQDAAVQGDPDATRRQPRSSSSMRRAGCWRPAPSMG